MKTLTLMHTSDWHLGHKLYGYRRDDEFASFLSWFRDQLREHKVDVLLIAGDIFDNGAPAAQAQKMYYNFLASLKSAGVRHVVITGGNHDSPSFLSAADEILKGLDIHVVSANSGDPEDEILTLRDETGEPELIVCAAPFLRERDLRELKPGETTRERNESVIKGLREHYARLAALAATKRGDAPVVASGHLFAGTPEPDSLETERDLYCGNLGQAPVDIFPPEFDYVALGHIHKPMKVDETGRVRYSGSPLPMSFREALREKETVLLRWTGGREPEITRIPIPRFRELLTLRGDGETIKKSLGELVRQRRESDDEAWAEIFHEGPESTSELKDKCFELTNGSKIRICCVQPPKRAGEAAMADDGREIDQIAPEEMFVRLMDARGYPADKRETVLEAFKELLVEVESGKIGDRL